MLTMTENAADVVKQITDQSVTAEDAGLRISQDGPDPSALSLAPAAAPETGDQVLEEGGARLFLDEVAAVTLDDKVLDAQVEQDGSVQFAVGDQPA